MVTTFFLPTAPTNQNRSIVTIFNLCVFRSIWMKFDIIYNTVKVGYCEIQGTEFLARYRRNSLLPTHAVEEFSLTEP